MDGAPFQLSNFEWMKLLDILIWGMRKPTYIGKHGGVLLAEALGNSGWPKYNLVSSTNV